MTRGFVKSRLFLFVFSFILLVGSLGSVSADADVAYIYRIEARIDHNLIDEISNLGLSSELIQERDIPNDLSGYKFLFLGDENFRENIPVNEYPSVIANYYHSETWGLTDADGVSQLGSSSPLSVNVDGRTIKVYTRALTNRGITVPYYYLGAEDVNDNMIEIAKAQRTSAGGDYGSVISNIPAGTRMLNGRTQGENSCFFGIVKTKYWTSGARELFEECVEFVASECNLDSECPNGEPQGEEFCSDGDVYQTVSFFSCENPGRIQAQCVLEDDVDELVEECDFGCSEGECLEEVNDVSLVDFSNAVDNIRIVEKESGEIILGDILECGLEYEIDITVENSGNALEDVSFEGSVGTLEFNHLSITDLAPGEKKEKTRTISLDLVEGEYDVVVEAVLVGDDNPEDNIASRGVFVSCSVILCTENLECSDGDAGTEDICENAGTVESYCTNEPITCSDNLDCGVDGFIGNEMCSLDGDVVQDFEIHSCVNPGTAQSSCSSETEERVVETCSDLCTNGECVEILCFENLECSDGSSLTFDECINPGTVDAECRNTEINCASDLDCGSSGFVGEEFCSLEGNVQKNFVTATCNNPGTLQSHCNVETEPVLVNVCSSSCSEGACVECVQNSDCSDGDSGTEDICNNPGTVESTCSNIPIDITCTEDIDCGVDGFIVSDFCSVDGNVENLYQSFVCNNPGNAGSYCSTSLENQVIQECSDLCTNGECVEILCFENLDCSDGDSGTEDICVNPGSVDSFCTNDPVTCSENVDCGVDGFIGNEMCSLDGDVVQDFEIHSCVNPGTAQSSCSSETEERVVETCSDLCTNGECVEILCFENLDCDDQNIGTEDICENVGTVESYCTNEPIEVEADMFAIHDDDFENSFFIKKEEFGDVEEIDFGEGLNIEALGIHPVTGEIYAFSGEPFGNSNGRRLIILDPEAGFPDIDAGILLDLVDGQDVRAASFNPKTLELWIGGRYLGLSVIDLDTGEIILVEDFGENIEALAWDDLGEKLYVVFGDNEGNLGTGEVFVYDLLSGSLVEQCGLDGKIESLEFGGVGELVAGLHNTRVDSKQGGDFVIVIDENDCSVVDSVKYDSYPYYDIEALDFVRSPRVTCSENVDCGVDGFIGNEMCSLDGDVVQDFEIHSCVNPGTAQSSCSSETEERVVETCSEDCSAGQCVDSCEVGSIIYDSDYKCLDEGYDFGNDESDYVVDVFGWFHHLPEGGICGEDGFYSVSGNDGIIEFETPELQESGEYELTLVLSAGTPGQDDESLTVRCPEQIYEFEDPVLDSGEEFSETTPVVCSFEQGVNRIVLESSGRDSVWLEQFRIVKRESCEAIGEDNRKFIFNDFQDNGPWQKDMIEDMSEDYVGRVVVANRPHESTGGYTEAKWSKEFAVLDPADIYFFNWGFISERYFGRALTEQDLSSVEPTFKEIISLPVEGRGDETILREVNYGNRNRKEILTYTVTSLRNGYRVDFRQRTWGFDNDEGGIFGVVAEGIFVNEGSERI